MPCVFASMGWTPDMPGTAALAGRIAEAELRLRDALLAGSATAELHADLAALRTEHERAFANEAEAAAKAHSEEWRAYRARVAEAAAGHVAAAGRLASRGTALALPSPPIASPDHSVAPTRTLAP
jgi:hypothetical protein